MIKKLGFKKKGGEKQNKLQRFDTEITTRDLYRSTPFEMYNTKETKKNIHKPKRVIPSIDYSKY